MSSADVAPGPVKAWIEPDRWAFLRAFPYRALLLFGAAAGSAALGYVVHPAFFVLTALSLLRHAAAEANLRELFRDGMLHPAVVVERGMVAGARGLLATLVRLESEGQMRDAIVISRMPRRWSRGAPPWGGARAAVVIAGDPPRLRLLSPDFARPDLSRARRATERIPDAQWKALDRGIAQLETVREGVHLVELGAEPWYGNVRELEVDGSLPPHLEAAEQHVWCAGLPAIEEPEMTDGERRRVARLRSRAYGRALVIGAALIAAILAFALAPLPDDARAPLLLALAATVPFSLTALVRRLKRARAYGRDLADGHLFRFLGSPSSFDSLALDRDLALLARRGVFAPEPGVEQDLAVLKEARELLHANGSWAPSGVTLHVSRVAAPPIDPIKLSLPRELRSDGAAQLDVARRRFTDSERGELARHERQLQQPGAALWVLTPLALVVLAVWGGEGWALPPRYASFPLVLGMWLIALRAYFRRRSLAKRMRTDAELGWVVTVDHRRDAVRDDPELPARGVESLLHARLDWTVNRRPATWRRFGH